MSRFRSLEQDGRVTRRLVVMALLIGILWVGGIGLRFGIRTGGDTSGHVALATRFRTGEMSYPQLFMTKGTYHATYVWMAWLGPSGFVWMAALLTACLPLWLLGILRHCGVGTLGCLGALAYAGANPELYKWAWYLLTDGLFMVQMLLLLFLVTKPSYPWWCFVVIPVLLYSFVFSRPTSFGLLPGLFLFAILTRERAKRVFLLALTLLAAAGIATVILAEQNRSELNAAVHRNFIRGQLIDAPPRITTPLPRPFTEAQAEGRSIGELCRAYPAYCAEYFSKKFLAYLVPVYPWYSPRHRLFNLVYFGSLLLFTVGTFLRLAWGAARRKWKTPGLSHVQRRAFLLFGAPMLTAAVFHAMTIIDSDARYLMAWTLPWICWAFLQLEMVLAMTIRDT